MPPVKRSSGSAAKPAPAKKTLYFTQDRETKGTFRYAEDTEGSQRGVMGTIWIQKEVAEELDCVDEVMVTIQKVTD
jgi:hypothetical protein